MSETEIKKGKEGTMEEKKTDQGRYFKESEKKNKKYKKNENNKNRFKPAVLNNEGERLFRAPVT